MKGPTMGRKIECIHFDLDSVLYIPSEFLETSLLVSVKAMIETGLKATPSKGLRKLEEIRSADPNAKNHFDRLCLHFNKRHDPLIIAAGVEKYWDCKVGIMTSAPEAKLVLSALYDKYPLVIITNGPPLKQAGKMVRLGLAHFFSRFDGLRKVQEHRFYATAEKGKMKPLPHLWLKAQRDLGYSFSRAVMVGDRFWEDIFGGKRLGMITVKVSQGPHAHETIAEAYKKASESEEMKAFFSKEHTERDMLRAMKPDYTIGSLRKLGDVLAEVEKKL